MKKGYVVVRLSVKNSELFQQYPPLSVKAVEKYGGKYLIRGGQFEILEITGDAIVSAQHRKNLQRKLAARK